MSKKSIIGVIIGTPDHMGFCDIPDDAVTEWHIVGVGGCDYHTLCGIDANDPSIGHYGTVEHKKGIKITCQECKSVWEGVKSANVRSTDFGTGDVGGR